ncbi:MAG: hypothetical protein OXC40_03070 [Proteobacteria bacterium]|nr:hypothetical protein [Pseudomonadota bacterium]
MLNFHKAMLPRHAGRTISVNDLWRHSSYKIRVITTNMLAYDHKKDFFIHQDTLRVRSRFYAIIIVSDISDT